MIKSYLITFIISIIVILLLMMKLYNFDYQLKNISDALFVVGIFMFFISLITMSKASNIFKSLGYTFKNLFSGRKKYSSYFDYLTENKTSKESIISIPPFVISITYIVLSLLLADCVM